MSPFVMRVAIAGFAFLGTWLILGQAGYRAGQLVMLGPAELDPELVRGLLAALAAVIGGSVVKLPWFELVRQTLVDVGLSSPLAPEEQRDLYERIKRIDERTGQ